MISTFTDNLTRLTVDRTHNPYIRFIYKKSTTPCRIKAFCEFTFEMFIHYEGKNTLCFRYENKVKREDINNTVLDKNLQFELLKWLTSEEYGKLCRQYTL